MAEKVLKLNLTDKQKDIYHAWLNPVNKYITVSCGRQVGKSQVACVIAIRTALQGLPDNPNSYCTIGIFLPTYKQTAILYKRIISLLGNSVKGMKANASNKEITFPNGSIIRFHTADNDNMRGQTYDYIIVDEACMVKGEIWEAGIEPTVSIAQTFGWGKVLLTSTPKEKNWFYNHFIDTQKGYTAIKFTSYESGLHKKEVLDDKRRKMSAAIFKNEYLAEFQDGSAGMFDITRATFIDTDEVVDKKAVVAAIDWGGRNDYTILTLINKNREVFAIHSFIQMDYADVYREITAILKSKGNPVCYSEKNGVGEHATSAMKRLYPRTREWTTSQRSKTEIMLALSESIISPKNLDRLKLPNDEELKLQFENFAYVFQQGQFKFVNLKAGVHDDIVMSIAIANFNFKTYKPTYV